MARRFRSEVIPARARHDGGVHVAGRVDPTVAISPATSAKRQAMACDRLAVEIVDIAASARVEYRFSGDRHLLAVALQTVRRAGETFVQGLPCSTLRHVSGRMSFVPARHRYYERHELEGSSQAIFIYLDPAMLPIPDTPGPRMLFKDTLIFALALNLKEVVETSCSDAAYLQAVGMVLAHQLHRPDRELPKFRGGLARWQQRTVAGHIEEHLDEPVRLAELAHLARLSPYHFARSFKQSFGVPPHRYHVIRRIEHAKTLLANSRMSVTEVGVTLGFCETSTFTASFRKVTGLTPTAFVRSQADRSTQEGRHGLSGRREPGVSSPRLSRAVTTLNGKLAVEADS
jgi:AraC family transcriptional regulator